MNKQELIEKIKGLNKLYGEKEYVSLNDVLDLVKQLDEPQKPVVPQFVADFISEQKKQGHTLSYSIDASMSDRVAEWYWGNSELFARAWLDGYEKEKRYRVKFIQTGQHIAKNIYPSGEYFVIKTSAISSTDSFTRKELEEAGFGWVFDCEGIEIEEVE